MYRGILMPFSSDDDSIDFIYGVINWKELLDPEAQAKARCRTRRRSAHRAARRRQPRRSGRTGQAPASIRSRATTTNTMDDDLEPLSEDDSCVATDVTLRDQLARAQQTAAAVHAADTRSRTTLYRALSIAHGFCRGRRCRPRLPMKRCSILAGITVQSRAPMTPIVKLVFGVDHDKTRLTEYAAVLAYARRIDLAAGNAARLSSTHSRAGSRAWSRPNGWRARRVAKPSSQAPLADAGGARAACQRGARNEFATSGDYVVLARPCAGRRETLDIVATMAVAITR